MNCLTLVTACALAALTPLSAVAENEAVGETQEPLTAGPANPPSAAHDRCKQGFVWREATNRDHVCVTPATRQNTAADNRLAASRRSPNGGPFGRDTCLQGFVWREAVPNDHVCVPPVTRDNARRDNQYAPNRVARAGGAID